MPPWAVCANVSPLFLRKNLFPINQPEPPWHSLRPFPVLSLATQEIVMIKDILSVMVSAMDPTANVSQRLAEKKELYDRENPMKLLLSLGCGSLEAGLALLKAMGCVLISSQSVHRNSHTLWSLWQPSQGERPPMAGIALACPKMNSEAVDYITRWLIVPPPYTQGLQTACVCMPNQK